MGDKVENYVPIHVCAEGADGRPGPVPDEPFVIGGAGGIFFMEIRPSAGIGAGGRSFDDDLGSVSIHKHRLLMSEKIGDSKILSRVTWVCQISA